MALTDRPGLERRLAGFGCQPVAQLHELNTFFDRPTGDLQRADRGLRIRVESDALTPDTPPRVILTHKGPRQPGRIKSRTETELLVADAPAARALFEALGYEPTLSFEKRRTRYRLGGCLIELDTLPGLGAFVEIEGPDEATVLAIRSRLGLDDLTLITASYAKLIVQHHPTPPHGGAEPLHIGFDHPDHSPPPSGAEA